MPNDSGSAAASNGAGTARAVAVRFGLVNLCALFAFYGIGPLLPLLLASYPRVTAWQVGFGLLVFNVTTRGASLFLGRVLNRTPIRTATASGLAVAAASFAILGLTRNLWLALVLLTVAGVGISVNGLLGRVWIASELTTSSDRNSVYSAAQVLANIAAALAPGAALLAIGAGHRHGVPIAVGALYLLAALAAWTGMPRTVIAGEGVRPPPQFAALRNLLGSAEVRRVCVVAWVSMFLYGQFFSAITLTIASLTRSSVTRSSFFLLNAGLVIVLALPITRAVNRRLDKGARSVTVLRIGSLVFSGSFLVMAVGGWSPVATTFLVVAIFSVGESIVEPVLSTAFTDVAGDRSLIEVFNLRQIATASGEAIGALCGGWLFLIAARDSNESVYWMVVASVSAAMLAATAWRYRSSREADPVGHLAPADSVYQLDRNDRGTAVE